MPVVNPNELNYTEDELHAADFRAGLNDATAIAAGEVGIIAVAEVGEDGILANYDAVIMGQPPTNETGDNQGNEMFVQLQDGTATDVADSVQFQFQARKKGSLSGRPLTPWIKHRGLDAADPRQRKSLPITGYGAVDGEEIILVVRDMTASVTVDLSNSSFEIPIMGGQ